MVFFFTQDRFPSGLFYINGVFYVDTRHASAKDYSGKMKQWASKIPEIGMPKLFQ